MSATLRNAEPGDAGAIATIHNEGVADRVATLRSEPRTADDVQAVIAGSRPLIVAERHGVVVGWAGVGPYDDRNAWYAGVGEATVYVARAARSSGVGRELVAALEREAAIEGTFKLIAKIFDTNTVSLRLFERAGYRRVGVHRRHGRLDGAWKDVVVLEKLIGDAAR
ncbi:arsinothricin resistance N-acetyltransferase ArsN1 [soil metagenome]